MTTVRERLDEMSASAESKALQAEQRGNSTEAQRIRDAAWREGITEALSVISEQIEALRDAIAPNNKPGGGA
jgi:hypothetical protein